MSGSTIYDGKLPSSKLRHNVGQVREQRHVLRCGHSTSGEHVVAGTVGRPKLYRCPLGCGLQRVQ